MNFKEKYREEINSLSFSSDYEIRLVTKLKKAEEGKDVVSVMKKRNITRLIAAVVSTILLLSLTAYAAVTLLSPQQVADEIGMEELTNKWQKSEKFPFTVSDEEYTVSVLGYASDTELNIIEGNPTKENRTYIVVSISRTDGTPLKAVDGMPLQISPLFEGYEPWKLNLWSLGANANGLEKDGVLYYLFNTGDLESFADKTVYIAAYEGFLPNEILTMNNDGTIAFKEDYEGFKALFELPLDETKANPERVKEILAQAGY